MDDQANAPGAAGVGTVERAPSFVRDVIAGAERVGEGIVDDIEEAAGKALGTGEKIAQAAVAQVESFTPAIELIRTLGSVHVSIGKFDVSAELAAAKAHVEEAIVALARHVGSAVVG